MSKTTIVDLPKLCQMLDNGWVVTVFKNRLGTYTARGKHARLSLWMAAKNKCYQTLLDAGWKPSAAKRLSDADFDTPRLIDTDDFTPEQAMTRLAYKVFGQII